MKIYLTLLIVLILSGSFFAQSPKFFDSPFALGGGYTPGWYVPKMDILNSELKNFGAGELSSNGFYVSGGGGFVYLPFVIPGLRVGGMGFGGSTSESTVINGISKEVKYSLSGGGLTVEYTLPFVRDIGISVGAIIGGGSLEIEMNKNSGSFNWNVSMSELNTSSTDVNRRFANSYWIISPTLNIDVPVYRFVALRLGAGYQFTFGGDWEADNGKPLTGVPSDISGKSFFIQSGIFIGFFSF
ncbi:MAG: hypothetical protein K8H86_01355 [Ignavibacteriaceae bacterium]|nr:hypothetical protein [Ignavibacteriaceae bacterium]